MSKFINIFRAGYNYGQRKIGVEHGPKYLFNHSYFKDFVKTHKIDFWSDSTHRIPEPIATKIDSKNYGHVKFFPVPCDAYIEHMRKERMFMPTSMMDLVANSNKKLYDLNMDHSTFRLNLVGDHSGVIGSVAASANHDENVVLVWIDAHADINTPETSLTGNIHGMPVSILTGMTPKLYKTHFNWITKFVKPSNILYIGVRDIDAAEEKILKEHNIASIHAFNFANTSQVDIMDKISKFVNGRNVHISFDIDAFDPKFIQCTGTPVASGLFPNQVQNVLTTIKNNSKVVAMDITEFNPLIEIENADKNVKVIVDNVLSPVVKDILKYTS